MIPLVFWVCLYLTSLVEGVQSWHITKEEVDFQGQLEAVKKNAIKTIKTADGDVFDCVDIYKQPAFSHPLLEDHKVELRPSFYPTELSKEAHPQHIPSLIEFEDGGCPQGSIPIQRLQMENLTRAKSSLGLSAPRSTSSSNGYKEMWAVTNTAKNNEWLGAGAAINVYNPSPVGLNQVSASVVWVSNSDIGATISAGWAVAPSLIKDSKSRVILSWSADGSTQCYNLHCPGFVQVNPNIPLGKQLNLISVPKGAQYIVKIYIYTDPSSGKWWLSYGKPKDHVGYWPTEIFNNFVRASAMQYGGYVSCPGDETCPPMGNGDFPAEKDDNACFFEEVGFFNSTMQTLDLIPYFTAPWANYPDCYNVGEYKNVGGQAHFAFTFGGPQCQ